MRHRAEPSPHPVELLARLPAASRRSLGVASALAREQKVGLYLVGGEVRDLLLGGPSEDLDLAVEGDALRFAKLLAPRLGEGASLALHPEFLTASLALPAGRSLDLAACRRERYAAPGALPTVEPGSIRDDLARRDFSVNALALRVVPDPPVLLDPRGGIDDLRARRLRVLHPASFLDDPTRILRGLRLGARLGLAFDPETAALARDALAAGAFATLTGDRLRRELLRLLESGAEATERLAELGGLEGLDPELGWEPRARQRVVDAVRAAVELQQPCTTAGLAPPDRGRVALAALAWGLDSAARQRLALRLGGGRTGVLLERLHERLERPLAVVSQRSVRPHEAAAALARLEGDELALLAALGGRIARAAVRRDLSEWRPLSLTVTGSDVIALGAAPGPLVGEVLHAVRAARLDGEIDAAGELDRARREIASRTVEAG
jgi:tRNA nucleotidyltransferase (CCA-adding enzyme)